MSPFKKSQLLPAGLACLAVLLLIFWWSSGEEKDGGSATTAKPELAGSAPGAQARGSASGEATKSWTSAGHQELSIDEVARQVEEAVRKTFLAYNSQDIEAFKAGWTDKGFQQAYERSKTNVKDFVFLSLLSFRPYTIGEFSNTAVYGTGASTEVALTYGDVQEEHRVSLIREGDVWKIDQDEKLAKFPAHATVVDVKLQFFKIQLDPAGAAAGTVAFKIANTDNRKHEFIVKKWLPDSDQEETIGLIKPLDPGKSDTLVLANLEPGKYIVLSNMVTRDAVPYAYGMRNEFVVQ